MRIRRLGRKIGWEEEKKGKGRKRMGDKIRRGLGRKRRV